MPIVSIPVNVEQNTYNAGVQASQFLSDVKAAVKSGSTLEEILAVGTSGLKNLVPVLENLPAIEKEASEDLAAEVATAGAVGSLFVKALRS